MGEATELFVVVHGAPDEPGALGLERLEELVVGLGGVDEPLSALEGDDLAVSGLEEPVDEEELSDVLRELDGLAEVLGLETLAALWAVELDELDDSSAEDLFEPMPELEGLDELLDPEVPESELEELDEPDAPGKLDDGDDSDELD